jgi:hypothetical protein
LDYLTARRTKKGAGMMIRENQEGGWNDDQVETSILFFYHGVESKGG